MEESLIVVLELTENCLLLYLDAMSTSFLDDMSMHPVNQSIQQTEFNKELD